MTVSKLVNHHASAKRNLAHTIANMALVKPENKWRMLLTRQWKKAMVKSMNEIKKEKIRQLAVDAHRKREAINALKMTNVPTDPVAREKQAVEFALRMADSLEADHLLKMEMYPYGVKPVEPQNQE